ncbi:MAG: hypothetical protein LKF36_09630 [Lactobacillus sp.]|jgi:hypothetical protein|nr:hypothetical protein [Lactobacillus sp.]
MAVSIVLEQFNIFNDPDITLDQGEYASGMVDDAPFFQIRFYARSPYFTENLEGRKQLARKYRRAFNQLKTAFAKKYADVFDMPDTLPYKFESLDQVNEVVKDLATTIQNEFVIPDKIELNTIELIGNWEVYSGDEDTKLAQELHEYLSKAVANYTPADFADDDFQ